MVLKHRRRFGSFRIRVPQSKWYFDVTIYPTRKDMHDAERIHSPHSRSYKFYARCMSNSCEKKRRDSRPCPNCKLQAGRVVFASPYVGAGIVAHEMTHAAVTHVLSCGYTKFQNENADERLAEVVGGLVTQFWLKWWKLPLRRKS